jgi:hypothetical protein
MPVKNELKILRPHLSLYTGIFLEGMKRVKKTE